MYVSYSYMGHVLPAFLFQDEKVDGDVFWNGRAKTLPAETKKYIQSGPAGFHWPPSMCKAASECYSEYIEAKTSPWAFLFSCDSSA